MFSKSGGGKTVFRRGMTYPHHLHPTQNDVPNDAHEIDEATAPHAYGGARQRHASKTWSE